MLSKRRRGKEKVLISHLVFPSWLVGWVNNTRWAQRPLLGDESLAYIRCATYCKRNLCRYLWSKQQYAVHNVHMLPAKSNGRIFKDKMDSCVDTIDISEHLQHLPQSIITSMNRDITSMNRDKTSMNIEQSAVFGHLQLNCNTDGRIKNRKKILEWSNLTRNFIKICIKVKTNVFLKWST